MKTLKGFAVFFAIASGIHLLTGKIWYGGIILSLILFLIYFIIKKRNEKLSN